MCDILSWPFAFMYTDFPMVCGAVSTNQSFAACNNQTCVHIPIVDDRHYAPDEPFDIVLERTIGLNERITLDPVDGVITIRDNVGKKSFPLCIYTLYKATVGPSITITVIHISNGLAITPTIQTTTHQLQTS